MDSYETSTPKLEDHGENHAVRALKNDLIWRKISAFLNFGDLKVLREVCTWLNSNVNNSEVFLSSAVLNLCERPMFPEDITRVASSQINWRHLKIPVDQLNQDNVTSISQLLERVQSLELNMKSPEFGFVLWGLMQGKPRWPNLQECVQNILKKCKRLIFLKVEDRLLDKVLFFDEGSSSSDLLLHHLHLQGLCLFTVPQTFAFIGLHDRKQKYKMMESGSFFARNLEILTARTRNLSVVAISDVDTTACIVSAINRLIQMNSATMTTLELVNNRQWPWSSHPPRNIVDTPTCPNLRNFKTKIYAISDPIIQYLRMLPLLETFEIRGFSLSIDLLNCIKERSSSLKKLHLKARGILIPTAATAEEVANLMFSWDFMKDLNFLEDFALVMPFSKSYRRVSLGNANVILESCLPPTMKKILLRGVTGNNKPINISILAQNCPQLTTLSLERCTNIIDDVGIQYMCTKVNGDFPFPNLTSFAISHCEEVTDAGIIGRSGKSESGFPISNRTGLRSLAIKSCKLTDDCVEGLKFQELRSLDLSGNSEISRSGILRVIVNNPSLEKLKSSVSDLSLYAVGRLKLIQFKDNQDRNYSESEADSLPRSVTGTASGSGSSWGTSGYQVRTRPFESRGYGYGYASRQRNSRSYDRRRYEDEGCGPFCTCSGCSRYETGYD